MITLHILQYLIDNGFLTAIDTDAFDEYMPLDLYGVSIYSVGGERATGRTTNSQIFELESRHDTDRRAAKDKLEKIAQFFQADYLCTLPTVPGVSTRQYTHCTFLNIGNIQNLGQDSEGKTIFKLTAQINYKK